MKRLILLVPVVFLAACADAKTDFENICQTPQRIGPTSADPATRAMEMTTWMTGHMKSKAAKDFGNAMGAVESSQRGKLLRDSAKAAGYTGPCPLADDWDAQPAL